MESLKVNSGDVTLDVQVWGEAVGRPIIVFLHGFPDTQQCWHHQVAGLKNAFRVVTFDMRGVGASTASSWDRPYQLGLLLEDIIAVIDAVAGKAESVHLVGHDWGAVLGWSLVSDLAYEHRIRSFSSLSGPHLGLMLSWLKESYASLEWRRVQAAAQQSVFSWYAVLLSMPLLPELMYRSIGLTLWRQVLQHNGVHREDKYLSTNRKTVLRTLLNGVNLYRQNPFDFPVVPEEKSIRTPIQILIPDQDWFISGKLFDQYDRYVEVLQKHRLPGRHWAHHSHADCFNRYVAEFVQHMESQVKASALTVRCEVAL